MTLYDEALAGLQRVLDDHEAADAQAAADNAATVDRLTQEATEAEQSVVALQAQVTDLQGQLSTAQAAAAPAAPEVVAADPFTDLSGFGVYDGAGSYAQQGVRLASNMQARNGVLSVFARPVTATTTKGAQTLQPGDYAAGGGMWKQILSPGCRISLDMQMTASWGTRAVCLLWPADTAAHPWPAGGELDFIENGGVAGQSDRQSTNITNHYFDSTRKQNNGQQIVPFGPHDFTVGSHVEVLWQTGLFVVTVDGVEAARFTSNVPAWPMKLAFQTAVEGGGQSPLYSGQARTPGRLDVKNLEVVAA